MGPPDHAADEPVKWAVVVPVKLLARAKSRLGRLAGGRREDLALAMAADTVSAALACPRVAGVVVVTDDPRAGTDLAAVGALVVRDVPDRGLNPALAYGAERARALVPVGGMAAMSADLPSLRASELGVALDRCACHPRAFVCDVSGTGTTLLAVRGQAALVPAFGSRSRARHRQSGALEVSGADIWSVRRDVDTEVDLYDALRLGTGPRTAEVAAGLQLSR